MAKKKSTAKKASTAKSQKSAEISAEDLEVIDETANKTAEDLDMESIEAEAEADERRSAAYESQEAEAPTADAATKGPAVKRRNLTGTKPSERLQSAFAEEDDLRQACRLTEGESLKSIDTTAFLSSVDGLAKKVGEKVVNVLVNRQRPASMSVFTRLAVQALQSEGSVTSSQLIALYQSCDERGGEGYSPGTARSQANQMMNLLPFLRIAERDGKQLALNSKSAILSDTAAAAAA